MKPLALVDLDDTLFQSGRKLPADGPRRLVATREDGSPICYQSPMQQQFTAWLLASTRLIPVTARSIDAFRRVDIAFTDYAIVSNGAVLLGPDGQPDAAWAETIASALAPWQQRLADMLAELRALAARLGLDIRSWLVEEDGLRSYVVVKHNQADAAALARLAAAWSAPDDVILHRNDNNLAVIPAVIGKRRAVDALLARLAPDELPVLGFGDSLSDLAYLRSCHFWATPTGSQLDRAL